MTVRAVNESLAPIHSIPRSIAEGENKLQDVIARGLLTKLKLVTQINTLVSLKKKVVLITRRQKTQTCLILVLLHADQQDFQNFKSTSSYFKKKYTDCRTSNEFAA